MGPDGLTHKAHTTFDTKSDAETWLATVRTDIVRDTWNPNGRASRQPTTFGTYAERWLAARSLEARTRSHYRRLLERHCSPNSRTFLCGTSRPISCASGTRPRHSTHPDTA